MKRKIGFGSSHFCAIGKVLALCSCFGGVFVSESREWTSRDGKKIEAELVEVKGESVVLKTKGKEVFVPLSKLSDEDAKYARAGGAGGNAAPGVIMVAGNKVTPGVKSTFIVDFNEDEKKIAKDIKSMPMQVRMTFLLHPDFDPKKENKIFFARTTHNNKNESGDIREMGMFEGVARKYGWTLAVFDSPKGCLNTEALDLATFAAGLRVMEETWPGSTKTWKFGAGGTSGGAKSSQKLMGILVRHKVKPYALFLSGCNQFMGIYFKDIYKVRPTAMSNVLVFLSNGLSDDISTISHAQAVYDQMKKIGRVRNIRFEKYEGGHAPSPAQVEAAFKWFDDPNGKK